MPKITAQKNGRLNDDDRLELVRLLAKAGYVVWRGKDKNDGKSVDFVGYTEPENMTVKGAGV